MLAIYIISLPTAQKRREFMSLQLEHLGLAYQFFPAINANDQLRTKINYAYAFREKIYGRHMTDSEIACFLSHRALWQEAVRLNQAICILEDDVQIKPNFSQALSLIENFPDYDLLRLAGLFPRKTFKWAKLGEFQLLKFWRDPLGAQGYIITPQAASKLLALSAVIALAVDNFIADYSVHGLNVLSLDPFPLEHNWEIPTQILGRQLKRKLNPLQKIRKELFINWRGLLNVLSQFNYFIAFYWRKI
jgi:glycosyl transferase family 25